MDKAAFRRLIQQKGKELYRSMPWRDTTDPYYVVVSELMLQQTQVERVIPKFNEFVRQFPNVHILASASLAEVLKLWSGLGYNRRAKFLHDTAKKVVTDFKGIVPNTEQDLISLPGIGVNTAGAILAYSFNQPVIFVETNIRTVYFHHFFDTNIAVTDNELRTVIKQTIDTKHPREFYQALMDYGTYLKKQGKGHIAQSSHYKKQSALKGSAREVRGRIVRALAYSAMTEQELKSKIIADERFGSALAGLIKDGLVTRTETLLHLTK